MNPPRYRGLVPATFTPMHPDGSLCLEAIEPYAEHLVRAGVAAVFVCGTTGEGQSLTLDERKQVSERWQSVLAGELPVIVHVGHTALEEARALSSHAERIGAAGIAALAPYFIKPALPELVEFCAGMASAAPTLPFYYYQIPSMTGVNVPVADFFERAADRIPNLAGAKFTYENLMDLQNALAFGEGRFEVLFGRDELFLAGLALGCTGAVGSTYSFAAPLFRRLQAAFDRGDLESARHEQQRAARFVTVLVAHGGLAAIKPIANLCGLDLGPTRTPLRRLTPAEIVRLDSDLRGIGFFDWIT